MHSVRANTDEHLGTEVSGTTNDLHRAQRLHGIVQPYSWGSRTAIAKLTGRPSPTDQPEAELWLGAHPNGPSTLQCGALLTDVISRAPTLALGASSVSQFGPRLPFLFKVLAAQSALSLQAHPTLEQARAGFARENAAGTPIDSPTRNYRDDNHKPELLVALTEFHALAGFRDVDRTIALFSALDVPELSASAQCLKTGGLRDLFEKWVYLEVSRTQDILAAVLEGCTQYLDAHPNGDFDEEAQLVIDLAGQYPGDSGVLAASLLNRITLHPGEGIYLDAGHLHAYLRGTGIEIMANSDNVLRGGLTTKHVDRGELMRVLRFESIAPPIVRPESPATAARNVGVLHYPTPAREFQLRRVEINESRTAGSSAACTFALGPQILLCTRGKCKITVDGVETIDFGSSFVVSQGESIWVPAGGTVDVTSEGVDSQVFIATFA